MFSISHSVYYYCIFRVTYKSMYGWVFLFFGILGAWHLGAMHDKPGEMVWPLPWLGVMSIHSTRGHTVASA